MARWLMALGLVCVVSCVHDWDRLSGGEDGPGGGDSSSSSGASSSSGSVEYTPVTFCQFLCDKREASCNANDGLCPSTCPGYIEQCQFPEDGTQLETCAELAYDNCNTAILADGAFSTCASDACQ